MLMIVIPLVIGLLTAFLFYYNWSRRHILKLSKQFRNISYPALPILGHAYLFAGKNEEMLGKIHNIVMGLKSREPYNIWFGPQLVVMFREPKHVEKILTLAKFSHKSRVYDMIKAILGEGLVTASGTTYRNHKKIIQPLLDVKFTNSCQDIFKDISNSTMNGLEEYEGKGTFDVEHVLHTCFTKIISETMMGTTLELNNNQGHKAFVQAILDVYNNGFTRLIKPWLWPDIIYQQTNVHKRETEIVNTLNGFVDECFAGSNQRFKGAKGNDKITPLIDQLGQIIENDPSIMSNKDFASHLLTVFFASEDTLTINASCLCTCFGMYPEYQKRAAEEIREVFGETPRNVTVDDIPKLKYLDMCLKDVLRLVPIAPLMLRKVIEDSEIDGWVVPKGAEVLVPTYSIHRDPDFWENPLHFHPDHFLPEAIAKRPIFAYFPFSSGIRGCIGKIFANISLRIFMATFLQRFEVEADGKFPDLLLRSDISTRPINGYNIRIKKRVWT